MIRRMEKGKFGNVFLKIVTVKYTILNFNDRLYLSVERYCTDLINGSLFRYIFFYRK